MAFDPAAFDPPLDRARGHARDWLRALPDRPVGALASRDELLAALRVPLAARGEEAVAVVDALAAQAPRGAVACGAPRYFGFVVGGSFPVALAADWLVSAWDQNAGIFVLSPLTAVCEEIAGEWLLDLFDLPRGAGVGFTTGCQMANLTCLAAARHGVLRRAGWDVERDGLIGAPRIHVVASAESHVTVDVALRYLGFGTACVKRVASDEQGRMRADDLPRVLATCDGPTIVCAQAGNVNTGAFDPLAEIAT
jgi:glutamate/tyrosine decarboxylase-like PLP-dependent enzyme